MRRKSTRSTKKSPEKPAKEESSSRRRSLRARKASVDESADESDVEKHLKVRSDYESENDSKNETSDAESTDSRPRRKRKDDSGTAKRTKRTTRGRVSPIKEEPEKEPENHDNNSDQEPEVKKGKGKSKTKSKIDQTSNIEPETQSNSEISENVQVTLQSPPVGESNKNVLNVIEQTESETTECVTKDTEYNNIETQQPSEETNDTEAINSIEEQSASPQKQYNAQSEHQNNEKESEAKSEPKSEKPSKAEVPHEKQNSVERKGEPTQSMEVDAEKPASETEKKQNNVEAKTEEKKTEEWSSTYEKQNNKKEENKKDKNTTDTDKDSPKKSRRSWINSANKEERKRKFSTEATTIAKKEGIKRKISVESSDGEKKEITPVFKKATKKIKLVRRSFCEQTSIDQSESTPEAASVPRRRKNWGAVDYRNSDVCKVDVESLKEVCPKLEFLEEKEVKLEPIIRRDSHVSVENDKVAKERRESQDQKSENEEKMVVEGENEPVIDKNIIAMNRKISIVDDTASKLKPPPSPAKNPVSEVLFISNLVRPFTLKALKELLERTGKLKEENGFWTDKIKSKCIVEYENAEEAEATRNALHGIHWPIGNGKKLQIEYSTKEDLDKALNPPAIPVPVVPEKVEKENKEPTKSVEDAKHGKDKDKDEKRRRSGEHVREWDLGKEDRRGRSRSRERVRKHSRHSPSPSDDFIGRKHRKEAVPQKLMDDLFLKTKATPSIYWQPLSPDEIQMKQQQRDIRMEEHKRRMEGSSRPPMGGGRDRGGRGGPPYRRRYD